MVFDVGSNAFHIGHDAIERRAIFSDHVVQLNGSLLQAFDRPLNAFKSRGKSQGRVCLENGFQVFQNIINSVNELVGFVFQRQQLNAHGLGNSHFQIAHEGIAGLSEHLVLSCNQVNGFGSEKIAGDDFGSGVTGNPKCGLFDFEGHHQGTVSFIRECDLGDLANFETIDHNRIRNGQSING